jgi:hypothetical protein
MPASDSGSHKPSYRNRGGHRLEPGPIDGMLLQRDQHGHLHEFHRPLDAPLWRTADRARHMRPDDAVLGWTVADGAFALPWWILKNHHVANLEFADRSIMIVLCEACAGAAAYDARIGGLRHRFRVDGKYNATHILTDLETGSLWTPFGAVALHGPLAGTRLRQLPLHQCTWREWRRLQPDTRVAAGNPAARAGHGSRYPHPGVRAADFERWMTGALLTRAHVDPRLDMQELVFGVHDGSAARAWPLARLQAAGSVHHAGFGDGDIVIFCPPGSWLAIAYRARVDGRSLHFAADAAPAQFRDAETGSRWNLEGRCVAGPLAGLTLEYVPCGIEKWYAWSAAHPGAELAPMAAP